MEATHPHIQGAWKPVHSSYTPGPTRSQGIVQKLEIDSSYLNLINQHGPIPTARRPEPPIAPQAVKLENRHISTQNR